MFRVIKVGGLTLPLLVATAIILLSAWSPWLSRQSASELVTARFNAAWEGVIDGCGFGCQGCGVVDSARQPFGFRVMIEYGCGMMVADLPEYHLRRTYYVSPLGTVHPLGEAVPAVADLSGLQRTKGSHLKDLGRADENATCLRSTTTIAAIL